MRTSESVNKLMSALAKAQSVLESAKKDALNPHFRAKYADLSSIFDAIRKPLADNGIAVMQGCKIVDVARRPSAESKLTGTLGTDVLEFVSVLVTRIAFEDQWIESDTPILCSKPNDPQALGSAITYARRYSLSAMLSVAVDDDDGEAAVTRDIKPAAPAAPAKAKAPSMSLPPPAAAPAAAPAAKNRDYPLPPPASKGGIPDDADCPF